MQNEAISNLIIKWMFVVLGVNKISLVFAIRIHTCIHTFIRAHAPSVASTGFITLKVFAFSASNKIVANEF